MPQAADPNARHNLKVRVWQGGTTHRVMLERLGFNPATLAYTEIYTGMQTGIVDGQIGGTAEMALDAFKDVTKTWVQYNDHFEHDWLFINSAAFEKLSPEDQEVLRRHAATLATERFAEVEQAGRRSRDAGRRHRGRHLHARELDGIVGVVRQEVWPRIVDEVGADIMARLTSIGN